MTASNLSHRSCQTSPTPPQNWERCQVKEFLTDSKTKRAEVKTKKALKKAPFTRSSWPKSCLLVVDMARKRLKPLMKQRWQSPIQSCWLNWHTKKYYATPYSYQSLIRGEFYRKYCVTDDRLVLHTSCRSLQYTFTCINSLVIAFYDFRA